MPARYGLGTSKPKHGLRWLYLPFLLLLSVGCLLLATQRVASLLGYHSALGEPWGVIWGIPWYAPWAVIIWQEQFGTSASYEIIESVIVQSQALFLAPQFFILGAGLFFRRKLKANADLHGSAHWATEKEIRAMGYLGGLGVYVGGWRKKFTGTVLLSRLFRGRTGEVQLYLRHNGPEHIMAFAPTRSGKGVGLILPTLLAWEGSSIVLDIKGENWALTAGWRKSQDQKVLRFDPSDHSGASASFNPLEEIRLDTLLAIPDVQNMAAMLVDPSGRGLEDHWSKAAFAMLGGALLHCCIMVRSEHGRAATLYDLSCMLADESRIIQDLFKEMVETDHAALLRGLFPDGKGGDKAHIFIAGSAREMLNKAENEASGVVSTALANLALYRDPVVALNTASCDFRIHDLMNHDKPVNLYLVISPADVDRMRPLLRLMVDMIVRRICARMEFADGGSVAGYKHRLLILLDEFTSLGKLPIMEKALAYIAGYGGKVYIIVQDITQLNAVYGKDNALMANCHVRIAYAPNTIETAKILSDMTGKTTVVEQKISLSGSRSGRMKNASMNVTETARPLLTPDECMRLPGMNANAGSKSNPNIVPGDMLVFTAGQPPIYGRQILYFLDPVFSSRSKVPVPGLNATYPRGISDSLYQPRPASWHASGASTKVKPSQISEQENSNEHYFME